MKRLTYVCIACFALGSPVASLGEVPPGQGTDSIGESNIDPQLPGVSIANVIDIVARKTGKKFVVDPRVHAQVQIVGEELNRITYPELLTILQLYGFAAVES